MPQARRALLLVAHGSRRAASNEEVRRVAARLRAAGAFDHVAAAFLELAEPDIPTGIEQCLAAGVDEVLVYPYFLSAGRHVSEDIPRAVAAKQTEHPAARIILAPHLGAAEGIGEAILRHARQVLETP